MHLWEKAVETFIAPWKEDDRVLAAIVCGSYALGMPREHSDIDIHIVLSDLESWRERGNVVVDGYLIEYFINPVRQVRTYFEEDYDGMRPHSMVQFINSKVIFDKTGIIERLRMEAEDYLEIGAPPMASDSLQITKYAIWDITDNLADVYTQKSTGFSFVYYNSLKQVFDYYNRYLQLPQVPFHQVHDFVYDDNYSSRYLTQTHPDKTFVALFREAMAETNPNEQMKVFGHLSNHVLLAMGGFDINGWSLASGVQDLGDIRPLNPKDEKTAAAIYNLQQKSYVLEAVIIGYAMLPPLHESIEDIQDLEETVYGYWLNGHLVGLIGVEVTPEGLHISRLAVDPEHKRKGFGYGLVDHVLSLRGHWAQVTVSTAKLNQPAIRLYETLGFQLLEEETTADGLELVKYKKILY